RQRDHHADVHGTEPERHHLRHGGGGTVIGAKQAPDGAELRGLTPPVARVSTKQARFKNGDKTPKVRGLSPFLKRALISSLARKHPFDTLSIRAQTEKLSEKGSDPFSDSF